jgi:hypothetical protein
MFGRREKSVFRNEEARTNGAPVVSVAGLNDGKDGSSSIDRISETISKSVCDRVTLGFVKSAGYVHLKRDSGEHFTRNGGLQGQALDLSLFSPGIL